MQNKVYINGLGNVSAQPNFEELKASDFSFNQTETIFYSQKPDYKKYSPPLAIRRMSKAIKMGLVAALDALEQADNPALDAILSGTGMGCLEDSEKFLVAMLQNDEQFLTPTPFIQSTHNTIGAQIALQLQCKAYNFTYVQEANSFESALYDAHLQIITNESNTILVGGVDETSPITIDLLRLIGHIKPENDQKQTYQKASSIGVVMGEGATFFMLENQKKKNTYAELVAVEITNKITNIETELEAFLTDNQLTINDIDAWVLGINNDAAFDSRYDFFLNHALIPTKPILYYKPISGEFHTATAYANWLACHILKTQNIPKKLIINNVKSCKSIQYMLLYNQYRNESHSFVLMKKTD